MARQPPRPPRLNTRTANSPARTETVTTAAVIAPALIAIDVEAAREPPFCAVNCSCGMIANTMQNEGDLCCGCPAIEPIFAGTLTDLAVMGCAAERPEVPGLSDADPPGYE